MYHSNLKTALQGRRYRWPHFTDEEIGLRGELIVPTPPSPGEQLKVPPGSSLNHLHKTAQRSPCVPWSPDKVHIPHLQQHSGRPTMLWALGRRLLVRVLGQYHRGLKSKTIQARTQPELTQQNLVCETKKTTITSQQNYLPCLHFSETRFE